MRGAIRPWNRVVTAPIVTDVDGRRTELMLVGRRRDRTDVRQPGPLSDGGLRARNMSG